MNREEKVCEILTRSKPIWGTYVGVLHLRGVVDSRNSCLTLANEVVVSDPVGQHAHFCVLFFQCIITACNFVHDY